MENYLSGLLLTGFLVANSEVHELTVQVSNVNSSEGQLIVCLWRSERGFPDCNSDNAIGVQRVVVPPTERAEVTFPNMVTGEYAVSVLHDLNSDDRTETNFLGIPREPVGSSGGVIRGGPPRFDNVKFQLDKDVTIDVELSQP